MPAEFTDKTGQPETEGNIKAALETIEDVMVKDMLKVPPRLAVQFGVIRRALRELLCFKKIIRERKNATSISKPG